MVLERGNWLVDLSEDYSQFFDTCNWYTFRFIQIECENDSMMGDYEFTIAILGLGLRVSYHHTDTEARREIMARAASISEETQP